MAIEAYDHEVEAELERGRMAAVCAWCRDVIRLAAPGHENEPASHGICARCLAEVRREAREETACSASQATTRK